MSITEDAPDVNTPRKKWAPHGRYIVRLSHAQADKFEDVRFGVEAKARDLYNKLTVERDPALICVSVALHEVLPDRSKRLLAIHRGDDSALSIRKAWLDARNRGPR